MAQVSTTVPAKPLTEFTAMVLLPLEPPPTADAVASDLDDVDEDVAAPQ